MSRRRRNRRDKRAEIRPTVEPSDELLRAFEAIERLKLAPVLQTKHNGGRDAQPAQQ